MPQRVAASLALIAFAVCMLIGLQADNTFTTTVGRALLAMFATFVIGLVLGHMAKSMLQESHAAQDGKLGKSATESRPQDR